MVIKSPAWWVLLDLLSGSFKWQQSVAAGDDGLLQAFKEGDETAFKLVFDQNFRKLYAFAYKLLKSKEHAEEIVHDAFLSVWSNRDRIDTSVSITPYMFTVTKRLALNSLRKTANSQKAVDELWKTVTEHANLTEEVVLLNDLKRFADSKIAILPAQQQQIFKMSRYDGLSYDEIAESLGLSKNTVRNHLASALKTLRKHFNEPSVILFVTFLKNFDKSLNFFHTALVHL